MRSSLLITDNNLVNLKNNETQEVNWIFFIIIKEYSIIFLLSSITLPQRSFENSFRSRKRSSLGLESSTRGCLYPTRLIFERTRSNCWSNFFSNMILFSLSSLNIILSSSILIRLVITLLATGLSDLEEEFFLFYSFKLNVVYRVKNNK